MDKKTGFSLLITIVVGIILYYFLLPPLNLHSPLFWFYVVILLGIYGPCALVMSLDIQATKNKPRRHGQVSIGLCALIILCIIVVDFILSPLFSAKNYRNRITIDETGDFSTDIAEVNFNNLPLLDKDSSEKVGDRVMGQMAQLVSQFTVSSCYTQINYNNEIIRVTPLEYNGIFKYFANRKNGVAGYISVNSVTGESNLTQLEKGMKYVPSALFFENLSRHVRLKYLTEIFDEPFFEIDNEGNPYWIIPTIKYSGIGLRKDISGVVIVNPIDGSSKKYSLDEVPTWVDHVYPAELVIEQVDDWGQYKNGFFNSIFGEKDVVQTTDGYNYLLMDDDVYLYTGITSKANDESNLGFILTNLRTKETKFYTAPGAEEYSAMASAEGQVQQMNYTSTFPLLINLAGRPTYMVSLKDNAGLVKMYGFIDVADYQKVVVTDAAKGIVEASQNYLNGVNLDYNVDNLQSREITIAKINPVVNNSTTTYYLVDIEGRRYKANIKVADAILPFLGQGSRISISFAKEKDVIEIISLEER